MSTARVALVLAQNVMSVKDTVQIPYGPVCLSVCHTVGVFVSEFAVGKGAREKVKRETQQHRCVKTACPTRVVTEFRWHA